MGYMRHHGMLITGMEEHLRKMHEVAASIFPRGIVADVAGPVVNYYYSFAIYTDGSKEGWMESDMGDTYREEFKQALKEDGYCSWVEVIYGDDYSPASIADEG